MSLVKSASFFSLAVILAGCSPSTQPPRASAAPSPVASNAAALAEISEDRAVMLLEAALKEHQVAGLECLGFSSESEVPAGSKAAVWEFAAREIHDEKCGGDPSISHVRDRYKISSNGDVSVYDVASDEYTAL